MHDVEMALIGQQLQVAPDGLMGDAEGLGQLTDTHRAGRAQQRSASSFGEAADRAATDVRRADLRRERAADMDPSIATPDLGSEDRQATRTTDAPESGGTDAS